ncbi:hypothetical protein [Bradyrhizobium neotropicale]|uniref:hypothetical protein n=1 Tax=Bradyrhizobium neotropicale TaxID=1497615 RepID=UPI000AC94621|nr:hypothetical protein [Bradyrhizobium neotropicale]
MRLDIIAATLAALIPTTALAQTSSVCDVLVKNPVFTTATISKSAESKNRFRLLQCSADWKSASDAQKAGIGLDIPIYDLTIPLDANWSDTKVEQWKSSHCSSEERKADYGSTLYASSYAIDPTSAQSALACLTTLLDRKAVRCSVTETSSAVIFEAEWRKTTGEVGPGPKVKSFVASKATCLNEDVLSAGKFLPDGGASVLCTAKDEPPVFSLNTDRGQCFAAGSGKEDVLGLSGTVTLDRATTFRAKRIKI